MKQAGVSSFLVALVLLATGLIAEAQQAKKMPRIGFLSGGSPSTARSSVDAFRQGLKDLGYVEGKNIALEYRFANGKVERMADLANELVHLMVTIIVAGGTPAALAAQKTTRTIPIVFATVADPLGTGLVASLARPGGNVTGATTINTDLAGKRLEVLKEVVPKVTIVAFLFNPEDPSNVRGLKESEASARALGLTLRTVGVRDPKEFAKAFSTVVRDGASAMTVAAGTLTTTHRKMIVDLAAKHKLPAMYGSIDFVEVGGLMSYAANFAERYQRAAVYVDKILKGRTPADLPVEQPTKFEFVVNLNAAKQIGLTVPPNVLVRADKVIK